jgi:hypothetical protein
MLPELERTDWVPIDVLPRSERAFRSCELGESPNDGYNYVLGWTAKHAGGSPRLYRSHISR